MGDFGPRFETQFFFKDPRFQPPKSPKWGTLDPALKPHFSFKPPKWGVGGLIITPNGGLGG